MCAMNLTVLDDGQFVRTYSGSIHPVAATFHRFVEAVARGGEFSHVRYVVPVRSLRIWEEDPRLPAVDQSAVEVVPTAPFGGIFDYLLRSPYLTLRNWRPINDAVAKSDLVWLRLPASNAPIALLAARRLKVAHFGWVAGSVGDVARAQRRPLPTRLAARAVGRMYDEVARSTERGGPVVNLDGELFNSVIRMSDVELSRAALPRVDGPPWTIAWAGRMAGEKGLPVLFEAFELLLRHGLDARLLLVGDGPERSRVEELAARLPTGRVRLTGFIGDFGEYLNLLRGAHVVAHPSGAEAVPKVVGEAMAAGTPVVATPVGGVAEILGHGERGRLVPLGDARALADAIGTLLTDPDEQRSLREQGLSWAADHTAERQAERLVGWLRTKFPDLP